MNNETMKLTIAKPTTRLMSPAGNCANDKCDAVILVCSTVCTVVLKMSNDLTLMNVDNALINANRTPKPKSFLMSLKGRQEYWSGLPCPPPGDLPHPGIEPAQQLGGEANVGLALAARETEAQRG